MRLPKFILPLVLSVLFATTVFSQNKLPEGYYVNLKKDTVRGFFDFDELFVNRVVFYATQTGKESQVLDPESVLKIETVTKMTIYPFIYTFKDKTEPIFVSKFVDGDIQVFKGKSLKIEESDVFCIRTTKQLALRKITATNPKAFLNTYFKGCELPPNFDVRYTENGLLRAVTEINNCAFPNKKIEGRTSEKHKLNVGIGFKLGGFYNKPFTTDFYGDRKSTGVINPTLGIMLTGELSNSISLYVGLNYFKRQLLVKDSFKYNANGYVDYYPAFEFKTNFLEVPIAVHYELNRDNPTYIPKLIAGVSALFPFGSDIKDIGGSSRLRSVYDISNYYKTAQLLNLSFFVGVGMKKILANKSVVELTLKYNYDNENLENTLLVTRRIHGQRLELAVSYIVPLSRVK
jgi:hypothetical protein